VSALHAQDKYNDNFSSKSSTDLPAKSANLMKDYFRSPVDYDYTLAGNFGELRTSHFHTGIDIKPTKPLCNIYNVADGYISRIVIKAGGYGNCVYIDHPEIGLTSVYAHLDCFSTELQNFIRSYQMTNETFTMNYTLQPHQYNMSRGVIIGEMGNTGHSYGRHLHFEIRETATEKPLNPLIFGLTAKDNTPPQWTTFSIHNLDADYHKIAEQNYTISNKKGSTVTFPSPITIDYARPAIAISGYDRLDNNHNKNGIYRLDMYVNEALHYSYQMDTLDFSENRRINGFYDFEKKKRAQNTSILCYRYPNNDLGFLKQNDSGLLDGFRDSILNITVIIADYEGNESKLQFPLKNIYNIANNKIAIAPKTIPLDSTSHYVLAGEDAAFNNGNCNVFFTQNSIFRNINFRFTENNTANKEGELSYTIHQPFEPIKSPISIGIKPQKTSNIGNPKAVIVKVNSKISFGGQWVEDHLFTKINEFGDFRIEYDNTAPSIKPISFSTKATKLKAFSFSIKDNYPTRGDQVDEVKYKVWIDDIFVISPFRAMNHTLTIPLAEIKPGNHILKIEAIDHSGNVSLFNVSFKR